MKQGCSFPASTSRPIWRLNAASWLLVSNALGQGNIARQLSVLPFFKGEDGVQHPGHWPPTSFMISHLVPISFSPVCLFHFFPMFSKFYHVGPTFVPAGAPCFLCLVDAFRSILMFGSVSFRSFLVGVLKLRDSKIMSLNIQEKKRGESHVLDTPKD